MSNSNMGSPGAGRPAGGSPNQAKATREQAARDTRSSSGINIDSVAPADGHQADFAENGARAAASNAQSGAVQRGGGIFSTFSHIGPVLLLIFLACEAWPDFWHALIGQAYFCPAELNTVASVLQTLGNGDWLKPEAAGLTCIPWPGYIWFSLLLAPAATMFFHSTDILFPIASTLAAALALLAAWGLAIGAGLGRRAAFAGGLILLCSPIFAPLAHFSGGAALAAAFLMLSLLLFFTGWQAQRSFVCLPLAFICTGIAGLCGGLFHLLLPLLSSILFLIWCGKFRRAHNMDAILGFVLLLVLLCGWFAAIILTTSESPYLSDLLKDLVRPVWEDPEFFFMPLLVAGIGLLPWLILVFCVSWHRLFANAITCLRLSRKDNAGSSMLWIAFFCGALLSFFSPDRQIQSTAVALACLTAILLGRSFIKLSDIGVRFFYLVTALLFFAGGLGLLALHFSFTQELLLGSLPFEIAEKYRLLMLGLPAVPVIAGICLVAALLLIRFIIANRHGNGLIYCTLVAIALSQPLCLMLVPELAASNDVPLRLLSDIRNPADTQPETGATENIAPVLPTPRMEGDESSENAPADGARSPIIEEEARRMETGDGVKDSSATNTESSVESTPEVMDSDAMTPVGQ